MKKAKASNPALPEKTTGTRIVEKYRPKMNQLTEADRKQLMEEGLAAIYHGTPASGHAHRG
jgi:hypothetical protein